jgi:hypothetical protein
MRNPYHRQYVTNIYNSWFVCVFPFFSPFYLNCSLYCTFPLFPSSHINLRSEVRLFTQSHSVIACQFHRWAACFLCWQCGVQFWAFRLKHFMALPQKIYTNSGTVFYSNPWKLPFVFFPVHFSVTFPSNACQKRLTIFIARGPVRDANNLLTIKIINFWIHKLKSELWKTVVTT